MRRKWLGFALGVLGAVWLAGCGSGPVERSFDLEIADGVLAGGEAMLAVNQDDPVTIVIAADEPVLFHLHGYDIEVEAGSGAPGRIELTAEATGSFPFTVHAIADDHDENADDHDEDADDHDDDHDDDADDHEAEEVELGRLTVQPR